MIHNSGEIIYPCADVDVDVDDWYSSLREIFTYNEAVPGSVGQSIKEQYDYSPRAEIDENQEEVKDGEFIEIGLHLLLFYIEILLIIFRGEHRVDNFNFIRKLIDGTVNQDELSFSQVERNLAITNRISRHLAQAEEVLGLVGMESVPFTFLYGSVKVNKKWLILWNSLTVDERRAMITRTICFHYLEGISLEYDFNARSTNAVTQLIATIDTEDSFQRRTAGLSKRALQMLAEGTLFVSRGNYDTQLAHKDHELVKKTVPFLLFINKLLVRRQLPWFSSGTEIVLTRAGTAGSFGGVFNNLMRVVQGDSGNAYGLSEPSQYYPKSIDENPISTWSKLIINRMTFDSEGELRELEMLEVIARILEENIQLFLHPFTIAVWGEKFGFALEELIADIILKNITLSELRDEIAKESGYEDSVPMIDQLISQGNMTMADLISSETKTIPTGYYELRKIFETAMQDAFENNLLLAFLFSDGFSDLMKVQVNGYLHNFSGIIAFGETLLAAMSNSTVSPGLGPFITSSKLRGLNSTLLGDIGFTADFAAPDSEEFFIRRLNERANDIIIELKSKQKNGSAHNPFITAIASVAPMRMGFAILEEVV